MSLYRLPVHVFYDDSFHARFGSAATDKITAIMTIVKAIYALPSLSTVLVPMIVDITYKAGQTWTATGSTLK